MMDDITEEEEDGLPPLLRAAKGGEVATFKTLLQNGADILEADKNNRTALHWATQADSISIILAGLSYGLSWHVNTKSKKESLTPLHEACLIGHKRITHLLLALGADIAAETKEGYTPLLCAAGNGHVDVTKALIGAGCDGDEVILPIGINALHIASWTGQAPVVKTLLEMGVEVETPSKMEKTAIEFAIEQGHTEVMEEIRNHRKKLDKGIHDKSFFQKKIMEVGDKIRGYYEETLKKEIEYFEEQMEDQVIRDSQTIGELKSEIERLTVGNGTSRSNIPQRRRLVNASPQANAHPGHRQRNGPRIVTFPNLSRIAGIDKITESDRGSSTGQSTESDSDNNPLETPSSDTSAELPSRSSPVATSLPRRTSRLTQNKSMADLVSEISNKETTMTGMRRKDSVENNVMASKSNLKPSFTLGSESPRSNKHVSFSPAATELAPYTPLKRVGDKPANTLSPIAAESGSSSSEGPRRRRKSFAEFFRPSSGAAAEEETAPMRRKSVASRMQSQPAAPHRPKPSRYSLSMLHFPLPGIQSKSSPTNAEDQPPAHSTPPI